MAVRREIDQDLPRQITIGVLGTLQDRNHRTLLSAEFVEDLADGREIVGCHWFSHCLFLQEGERGIESRMAEDRIAPGIMNLKHIWAVAAMMRVIS